MRERHWTRPLSSRAGSDDLSGEKCEKDDGEQQQGESGPAPGVFHGRSVHGARCNVN